MISVVVPVYNGEKYLDNTIKALLQQPFKDIELILVNDGSTDSSRSICEYYQLLDERIVVINKENEGISVSRNYGLKIARGEYISFIDQDDIVNENIYLTLSQAIGNSDMCIAGKIMHLIDNNEKDINTVEYTFVKKVLSDKDDIFSLAINSKRDTCALHLWNCLYKKRIIEENNIQFNENLRFGHEDTLFNIQYLAMCNSVAITDKVVYEYYRRTNHSTSLKANVGYINDFRTFSSVFVDCWNKVLSKNDKINECYTFLIRLCISLYAQYGIDCIELESLFRIIGDNIGLNKITNQAINSRLYCMYLSIVERLLVMKQYRLASAFIKNLKRG